MSIAINPVFPVIGAQGAAPDVALQPGTVIDATVLKVLENNFVRIAIANLSIDVLSEIPLQVGQALQLAVSQTPQGVKLAIVPSEDGVDNSLPALTGSTAGASASVLSDDGPATNVAPNIAAPKIAPTLDAAVNTNAARPLTNLEALAVSAAVQTAASKQASLAPLFANLSAAATSANLPPVLQQAASALLALRPDLNGNISGDDIKAAFEKSGLFFEQSQAVRATVTPATAAASSPVSEQPDLKAALIVFRQTVAAWLDTAPQAATSPQPQVNVAAESASPGNPQPTSSPSIVPTAAHDIETQEILLPQASLHVAEDGFQPDAKVRIYAPSEAIPSSAARVAATNAGLTSLQEILQAFPKGVADAVHVLLENETNASLPLNANGLKANTLGANPSDTPPPFRGAATSAQPVASSSFAQDAEPVTVARHLVSDADAAIARQTLLQVASLSDRVDLQGMRQDINAPRWNFEIPFATPQGTAVAQFEISRDGSNAASVDATKRVWKARFSLNVEPAGPVHALVSLSGERASVRMWAERPSTASQLRANAPQLTHALREAALEPGDIVIGDGAPPQPPKPPAGHFLDRAL